MSKQEYDELWGVITDENKALNEILEELKRVFPDARIERDQVFGNVIVASLQADDDVWLYANAETGRYFVSIAYEKGKLRILLVLKKYFDVTYDLSFVYWYVFSIKEMIQKYNKGKEIELYDAMVWINTFVAKEKRWKACEKHNRLFVCLRPYILDDEEEGTYVDVYRAKGEITASNLSIKFYPIRRKMRFVVHGTLTTKRFSALLDIITSFEIG
jgi:hypothetical protein